MSLHVRCLGDAKFEAANAYDRQQALARFNQGDELFCEIKKPRSSLQSRALFAALQKVFDNQREGQERWESPDHLRADAFCTVGFKTTIFYELPPDAEPTEAEMRKLENFVSAIVKRVYDKDNFAFIRRIGVRGVAVDRPKSWAFHKTEHKQATEVFDAVFNFFEDVSGLTRKQLLEAVEKDAA